MTPYDIDCTWRTGPDGRTWRPSACDPVVYDVPTPYETVYMPSGEWGNSRGGGRWRRVARHDGGGTGLPPPHLRGPGMHSGTGGGVGRRMGGGTTVGGNRLVGSYRAMSSPSRSMPSSSGGRMGTMSNPSRSMPMSHPSGMQASGMSHRGMKGFGQVDAAPVSSRWKYAALGLIAFFVLFGR